MIYSNVNYHANGGTGSHTDPGITLFDDYRVRTLADTGITRDGFRFMSWNTAPDGSGITYMPGDPLTVAADVNLYAQWRRLVSVSYLAGINELGVRGIGTWVDADLLEGDTYTIRTQDETGIIHPDTTRYRFRHWNTAEDGSGIIYEPGTVITLTGDLVLHARWLPRGD
jgi:hypothetical protein